MSLCHEGFFHDKASTCFIHIAHNVLMAVWSRIGKKLMPLSSTAFSPFFLFSKKTIFKFWQVVRVNDIRKRWTLKAVLLGTRRRQPHKCAKVIKETLELVLWMLLSVPERFLFVRSLVFQQQFTLQVQAVLSPFLSLALSLSPLVSAVLVKVCNGYWNMHCLLFLTI